MSYRKILCPVDFSEATAQAARWAASLAQRHNAALTLLHVAPAIDFGFAMAEPASRNMIEFAEHRNQAIRDALDLFPGDPGLGYPAERVVAVGNPAEEIIRLSQEDQFDLIVMPTHGAGAIRRWLLVGSVTTKVLHGTDCPVVAATDFTGRANGGVMRHVLCALDLGAASSRVLCAAGGLARIYGASLTIVHAVPDPGEDIGDYFDDAWRARLNPRVTARIRQMLQEAKLEASLVVESGMPEKVVHEAASRVAADLVVTGRGESRGILGRLRAHTYEIIRHSPCPVLCV